MNEKIVTVSGVKVTYWDGEVSSIKPCRSTTYKGWTVWANRPVIFPDDRRDAINYAIASYLEFTMEYDLTYLNKLIESYVEDKAQETKEAVR